MANAPQAVGKDTVVAEFQRAVASIYKVEQLVGRGRTTSVYKAAEIKPPRPVALKVLPPGLGTGPAAARFKDEARKALALNHSGIVPIYRVGLKAGVPFFVAMKLVEGPSLRAIIEAQGALPVPAILVALRVTAEALNFAQGHGTMHGRLHAANILVDSGGHVVVSDFGIARALEDAMPAAGGKPAVPGQEPSDQYALGIVALQMLAGSVQPLADPVVSALNIRSVRDGLPDALVQVVQTALAQDPAQRYASATDMLAAIKAIPLGDAERREGYVVLGQLARGEPVPKVPVAAPPRRFEARPSTRLVAPVAPTVPAAKPAPTAPAAAAAKPAPAAPAKPIAPVAPAPPRVSAPMPAPPAPPEPEPPDVEVVRTSMPLPFLEEGPTAPPVRARPSGPLAPSGPPVQPRPSLQRVSSPRVRTAPFAQLRPPEPAPRRRSRVVWVLAALLVTAGIAGGAYLVLGRRPAAGPTAQAPVASQAPSVPTSVTPVAPAVAESARADSARRAAAAAGGAASDAAVAPQTGRLSFSAVPATARIFLDGKAVGTAAVDSDVTAGRKRVRISAPGYPSFDSIIRVRAGETVDLGEISLGEAAAEPAAAEPTAPAPQPTAPAPRATGRLRLRTVPPTAEIFVDGQSVGVGALLDFEVAAGQRQLRISAPGYVTYDTLIAVISGTTFRLGQVSLKSSSGGP